MMLYLYLLGYCRCRVKKEHLTGFFEFCRQNDFSPRRLRRDKKSGALSFYLTLFSAAHFLPLAKANGQEIEVVGRGGLPVFLRNGMRRPGIILGVLAALALLVSSRFFLWDIRFSGATTLPEEELRRELALSGLNKGRFLPSLDTGHIEGAMLEGDSRLSYVSVNIRGTVATVQFREAEKTGEEKKRAPANLVAGKDGVIILPMIYEGKCAVAEGEAVRAGQLLASGLLESDNNGTRFTRAAGEVYARTVERMTLRIPFEYEEKVYTGKRTRERTLLFFGKEGKLFKTTGNESEECDIIESEEWLRAGTLFPFGLRIREKAYYRYVPARRDAREALALAKEETQNALGAYIGNGERKILSYTTEICPDESGITLILTITGEENIAVTAEFPFS